MKLRMGRFELLAATVLIAVHTAPAAAGQVSDLIDVQRTHRAVGTGDIPSLAIAFGIRRLGAVPSTGPAAVSEALNILADELAMPGSEPEAVILGVLRGVALVDESTNPGIHSTLCQYRDNLSLSSTLRNEATEGLRLRCIGTGSPPGCNTCP